MLRIVSVLLLLACAGFARADDKKATGTLTGRFVFDGEPPAATDLLPDLSKIDPAKPHPGPEQGGELAYRSFLDHGIRPNTKYESLVVGKKNGVANVVIWAASKDIPWTAPDDLGKRPVTIKLKNGHYSPRVTVAAVGQPVLVENHDPVGFHFRVDPSRPRN